MEISNINITDNTDITDNKEEYISYDCSFNYVFQEEDVRDHFFTSTISKNGNFEIIQVLAPKNKSKNYIRSKSISPSVYTISNLGIIQNQITGDCVANAFSYCINAQTYKTFFMSRCYSYTLCKLLQGFPVKSDPGANMRNFSSTIQKYGAVKEEIFPYISSNLNVLPPLEVFKGAKYFEKFTYTFVGNDLNSIKACLTTYNTPILFGFKIFTSFISKNVSITGMVPLPARRERALGGHCMCVVGYDDNKQAFLCANSWGTKWALQGYCYMPYKYLLNRAICSDFCITEFKY